MKVMGKMFAMIPTDADRLCITVNAIPRGMKLREEYGCVKCFHMNKTHWNTIWLDGDIRKEKLKNGSITLWEVVMKLPKKLQQNIMDQLSKERLTIRVDEVDSTNLYLKRLPEKSIPKKDRL